MRRFSWSGWAALATAAVTGYLTCEAVHNIRGRQHAQPMIGFFEESDIIERTAPGRLPTLPAEEIDLTCLPQKPPDEINRQTSEPPLADGPEVVRAIEYRSGDEFSVHSGVELPAPQRIPYLTDDASSAPAILPMPQGDDAASAYPVRQCTETPTGPIWNAVAKFFGDAAKCLPSARIETPPAVPGDASGPPRGARERPPCCDEHDFINPNLGKPPTGVLPEIREIPDSTPIPGDSCKRRSPTADG